MNLNNLTPSDYANLVNEFADHPEIVEEALQPIQKLVDVFLPKLETICDKYLVGFGNKLAEYSAKQYGAYEHHFFNVIRDDEKRHQTIVSLMIAQKQAIGAAINNIKAPPRETV